MKWRHEITKYREWNGSSWITVSSYATGGWLTTGPDSLTYHSFVRDIELEGGGLVEQRLRYKKTNWLLNEEWNVVGFYHRHYLE